MPRCLRVRTALFRNYDQEFERLLSRPSAERRIPVDILLRDTQQGFALTLTDDEGYTSTVTLTRGKEVARTEQRATLEAGLAKLGGTIFVASSVEIDFTDNWFIPSSVVADMRRTAVEALKELKIQNSKLKVDSVSRIQNSEFKIQNSPLTYLANVANQRAAAFYRSCGATEVQPAYEISAPRGATLMFCRHCLRYAMGWCPHRGGKLSPYREPYTLVSADGARFKLEFDCKACIMKVKRN